MYSVIVLTTRINDTAQLTAEKNYLSAGCVATGHGVTAATASRCIQARQRQPRTPAGESSPGFSHVADLGSSNC